MPSIELVWDEDCPNVDAARTHLACCRLSVDPDGKRAGAPTVHSIVSALRQEGF